MLDDDLRGHGRRRLADTVTALVLGAVVLGAAGLGACSADDEAQGPNQRRGVDGSTSRMASETVRTVVVPGKRVGAISRATHIQVARRVASVVDGWWDAAFVEADYPRRRYQRSFPGFTQGAAAQAWRQRDLTTSARLGQRIDALVPLRRRVAVDVLATGEVARAVTARVRMDYRTRGEVEKRIRVQGRLLLTFESGWKVFGFDLTQGPIVPSADPGRASGRPPEKTNGTATRTRKNGGGR